MKHEARTMLRSLATLLLAVVVAVHVVGYSHAFHANHGVRPRRFARPSGVELFGAGADETNDGSGKRSSMMNLSFIGEVTIRSQPAPLYDGETKSLHDFFALPQSAPLLLGGLKSNEVNELGGIDSDLLIQYRQMCERVGAVQPSSSDRVFEVTTSAVKFPGLQIMTVATIGVQIACDKELPGYQMVLIRDSTYATGNALFVWFFNRVTGKDKGDDATKTSGEESTFSLNKISVIPDGNGAILFESIATLEVQIKFPSFLMKVIPGASPEKFDRKGSEALRKALEGDVPTGLEAFRQEYVRWLEN